MRLPILLGLILCFLDIILALPLSRLPSQITGHRVDFCCQDICHDFPEPGNRQIFGREPRRRTYKKKVDLKKLNLVKTKHKKPSVYNKYIVKFNQNKDVDHSAGIALDNMGLSPKHRKTIEDFHVWTVKQAMKKIPEARKAEIINIAHSRGSKDPNIHITAEFRSHWGIVIQGVYGHPPTGANKRHIYVNSHDKTKGLEVLPKVFKDAVEKHQVHVYGKFDKI